MAKKESHKAPAPAHHSKNASAHAMPHTTHTAPVQHTHHVAAQTLEEKMIHNLVELQKVHTDLAEKFDKLSSQMGQLLTLFELSARAFAKQTNIQGMEKDREFLDKIDKLLDQNKVIAKGLTLMEDKMRERLYGQTTPQGQPANAPPRPFDVPRPLPRF